MSVLNKKFGLAVIAIALVDVLAQVEEAVVATAGMHKGGMNLIDRARALELDALIAPEKIAAGGSAANSLAGFASFGGRTAMIGKVSDDSYGDFLRTELKAQGTHFVTRPHKGGELTGRSYILITPDGERTMNTYLGANSALRAGDVTAAIVAQADILLIEGYAFDQPGARAAVEKAVKIAKASGTKIAFTLSDSRCVERHRADFAALVRDHVDILLGNEKEAKALTLKNDFNEAAAAIGALGKFSALTRGAKGALIQTGGRTYDIAPVKPEKLVDTTGAGDAFAAGVLYGLSQGFAPDRCGELGARAASATIGHVGARSPAVKFSGFLR
jgi:sugar/nucleoside kinase (ribokinase family)